MSQNTNQPKRYSISHSGRMLEKKDGHYVRYEDYASTKEQLDWTTMRQMNEQAKHEQMFNFICDCVAAGNFKVGKKGDVYFGKQRKTR